MSIGTGSVTPTAAAFTVIPGLTRTVNVPANSIVFISTDGGMLAGASSGGVDVSIHVDGGEVASAGYRRYLLAANGFGHWSMALVQSLSPGTHTIDVTTKLFNGTAPTVGGGNGSTLQGQLSLLILKR